MAKRKKSDKRKSKKDKDKHVSKSKLIRDGFTMPEQEYARIAEIKDRCLRRGIHAKKSEILRAGLLVLSSMTDSRLEQTLERVERVKTGRPPKQR